MRHTTHLFGRMPDGTAVHAHVLENDRGMRLTLLEYGAILHSLVVPNRSGSPVDVVLGQETLSAYASGAPFAGAVIGRVANRIAGACFTIGGTAYLLEKNMGDMNIHSGSGRYAFRVFRARDSSEATCAAVTFSLLDNGQGGFPGTARVRIRYALDQRNVLTLSYQALPSQITPVSITNHAYFNLSGHASGSIFSHQFAINADFYLPNGPGGLPTGEVRSVAGTRFDWRQPETLGRRLADGGFDHNFCIRGRGLRTAATAFSPDTGIRMRVETDLPGMQFFTPARAACAPGKEGAQYCPHAAFCFETQHYPNAVNLSQFPCNLYSPRHPFRSQTIFHFDTMSE